MRRWNWIVAAALLVPGGAHAASPDALAAQRAAAWLEDQTVTAPGQQADTIVALAAAGRTPASLQGRLAGLSRVAPGYASGPGSAGKVVLATVAAGGNPRSLGGVDYVARIRAAYRAGRYGASAYDQAYAMLGLSAAGDRVPPAAIAVLRRSRSSGGWGFSIRGGPDDVSATGLLMEALRAAGVSPSDPVLRGPATWIAGQANRQGGFNINGGRRPTEANSTAIAIRAWRAAGRKPLSRWRVALRGLQEADGGVRFSLAIRESRVIATSDALVAFSGGRLPS
jgi:hypothetical protein